MCNRKAHARFLPFVFVLTVPCFAAPLVSTAGGGGEQQSERGATVAVKQLIAKYAEIVNAEPVDLGLASDVWLNSPKVSLIFPLGEEHGWEQVKRDFYENTMEALFSERKLTPRDITVHMYGDSAWAEFSWNFVAKRRKDGSVVETSGRETQIYRKTGPERWALVHVHYSPLPPAAPAATPSVP